MSAAAAAAAAAASGTHFTSIVPCLLKQQGTKK